MKGGVNIGVTQFANGSYFVPIRSGQVCPVCGSKKGRCSEFYNEEGVKVFYRCKYAVSSRPSKGWYIHLVSEVDGYTPQSSGVNRTPHIIPDIQTEEIHVELRDKVYRKMRELMKEYIGDYLYLDDKHDLLRRGLNEEQIERIGVFSIPRSQKVWYSSGDYECKLVTAISQDLYESFGNDLLKVPGFIKLRKRSTGDEYITLKTRIKDPKTGKYARVNGYYIPYQNLDGYWEAMQFRLTEPVYDEKGKKLRYFWLSSSQARSGSPVSYYVPTVVKRQDILLVTEGALKGQIASEYLGYKGMFIAGVHNYRRLAREINRLDKKLGIRHKILLAYDMDKYTNQDVLEAEKSAITEIKSMGNQVATVEWNGEKQKGIDDAVVKHQKLFYKLY